MEEHSLNDRKVSEKQPKPSTISKFAYKTGFLLKTLSQSLKILWFCFGRSGFRP